MYLQKQEPEPGDKICRVTVQLDTKKEHSNSESCPVRGISSDSELSTTGRIRSEAQLIIYATEKTQTWGKDDVALKAPASSGIV